MNIEEALELFEEIVELCYQTENPRLLETLEDIYSEASSAKDLSKLILSCAELQIVINEENFTEDEEEVIQEIEEKIELMSE